MKQMKYIILVSVIFLNINILSGQEKTYNSILKKVEANVDKNYYSDSIFAIRHSEYILDASTQDMKKIVCVNYFQTPVWALDGKSYNQKFGFNNSTLSLRTLGYLISAKLYKKEEENNYGYTSPHRFASSFSNIDINGQFHSVLSGFVRNKKVKKDSQNNMNNEISQNKTNIRSISPFNTDDNFENKSKISVKYGYTNNKQTSSNNAAASADNPPQKIAITSTPIYTIDMSSNAHTVDNVVYEGVDCYKLIATHKKRNKYGEFERQRFEDTLIKEYSGHFPTFKLSEQQENELRRLVEYWANGEEIITQTYIVNKKNFAVLLFQLDSKQQNSEREWFNIEKITEKYQEGKDKKYRQTIYEKFVRNYNGGFPNTNNFITLVFRTPSPSKKNFSVNDTTVISRTYKLAYEDFCEKVDVPDEDMLFDWNQYEAEK